MPEDLQNMKTPLLVENYRALCRGTGSSHDPAEVKRLSHQADLYEEEIFRRMAW
jgi:hypothetical protein